MLIPTPSRLIEADESLHIRVVVVDSKEERDSDAVTLVVTEPNDLSDTGNSLDTA